MEFVSFDIESMDFRKGGSASRALKERLKLIGADAEAIRRTMIAAYEAEMNVVIHSSGGKLTASLSETQVEVDVVDVGPGIADTEKAMTAGFSTASAEARALGFGAGLGLPNIKKNSDRMRLTSRVGEGTRVSFTVDLRPGDTHRSHPISLHASPDRCRECRACLLACPTRAIRVRDGKPSVLEHLCVDCAQCITVCPFAALDVRGEVLSLDDLTDRGDMTLVIPPALLSGCGPEHTPVQVWEALDGLGFCGVATSEPYETDLVAATAAWAAESDRPIPAIAPCCPAVVNLIELRFPSLVPHLAPFDSPWEAIQSACADDRVAYVVSCPGQRSALLAAAGVARSTATDPDARPECLLPGTVHQAVMARLAHGRASGQEGREQEPDIESNAQADVASASVAGGADATHPDAAQPDAALLDPALTVTGAAHVLAILEQIEDGLITDIEVVLPYMCEGGCFGSPLLSEDHHLATRRWAQGRTAFLAHIPPGICGPSRRTSAGVASSPLAASRRRPFTPRPGIRLDADMGRAIDKLGRLQATIASLPGRDCGSCGAPTCAALAEDVIMQRAETSLCPYLETTDKEGSDR